MPVLVETRERAGLGFVARLRGRGEPLLVTAAHVLPDAAAARAARVTAAATQLRLDPTRVFLSSPPPAPGAAPSSKSLDYALVALAEENLHLLPEAAEHLPELDAERAERPAHGAVVEILAGGSFRPRGAVVATAGGTVRYELEAARETEAGWSGAAVVDVGTGTVVAIHRAGAFGEPGEGVLVAEIVADVQEGRAAERARRAARAGAWAAVALEVESGGARVCAEAARASAEGLGKRPPAPEAARTLASALAGAMARARRSASAQVYGARALGALAAAPGPGAASADSVAEALRSHPANERVQATGLWALRQLAAGRHGDGACAARARAALAERCVEALRTHAGVEDVAENALRAVSLTAAHPPEPTAGLVLDVLARADTSDRVVFLACHALVHLAGRGWMPPSDEAQGHIAKLAARAEGNKALARELEHVRAALLR